MTASVAGEAGTAKETLQRVRSEDWDILLLDISLPDGSGIDLVAEISAHHPNTPTAVITAFGNVEAAVDALRAGAFDFVSKPVDLAVLRGLVQRALDLNQRRRDVGDKLRADAGRTGRTRPVPTCRR